MRLQVGLSSFSGGFIYCHIAAKYVVEENRVPGKKTPPNPKSLATFSLTLRLVGIRNGAVVRDSFQSVTMP